MEYLRLTGSYGRLTENNTEYLRSEILGSEVLGSWSWIWSWPWIWPLDLALDLALEWSQDRPLRILYLIYTGLEGL